MKISFLLCLIILLACGNINPENQQSDKPTHKKWHSLLQKHVTIEGMVDYEGMIADSTLLNEYLQILSNNAPNTYWSENEKLAYWINLYNASTIKLITKHYPITSIKDIGSAIQIPFINTPWQIKFISISNKLYHLDDIEHNIIRQYFDEPRIHFALVCAAMSCPKLRNEVYTAGQLDKQLTNQAQLFLTDTSKNKISRNAIIISKIFRWYGGDFKKKTKLIEYLNQFSITTIDLNAKVDYMDYDWCLNSQ